MKRVSSYDVAKRARVSRATVSAVVNERTTPRISEETRQRVLQAIDELGYVPHLAGRSLKTGISLSIGIIVPTISDPFMANVVQGIEDACLKVGYGVLLCNAYRDVKRTEGYVRDMVQRQVDGLIVIRPPRRLGGMAKMLDEAGLRTVYVDVYPKPWTTATVTADSEAGGYQATSRLLALGHRRIMFLSGPLHIGTRLERFRGYRRAMSEWRIPVDRSLVWIGPREYEEKRGAYGNYELELGRKLAQENLEARATAAVTTSDLLAIGVMRGLFDRGCNVPSDFSIIGSDHINIASFMRPSLSVVSQPKYRLGQEAADLLLGCINGSRKPEHIVLPVGQVQGGTVAPPAR